MKSMNFYIKTSFMAVLITTVVAMINGCAGGGGGGPTSDASTMFNLAKEVAAGNKTDADLEAEFKKFPDKEMATLAKMGDKDNNFMVFLVTIKASPTIKRIMERFLFNVGADAKKITDAKTTSNKNSIEILFGSSSTGGSAADINAEIAVLARYNSDFMNGLAADGPATNDLIEATDDTKMDDFSTKLPDAKFEVWLGWAMEKDATTGALKNQVLAQPEFKKLYAGAVATRKEVMRNALLKAVYDPANVTNLAAMIGDSDNWGIEGAIANDKFKMALSGGSDAEGNFLYVVVNRILEDIAAGGALTDAALKLVSLEIKKAVGANYTAYASSNMADGAGSTTVKGFLLPKVGNDNDQAEFLLSLKPVSPSMIFDEVIHLANEAAPNDRAVSPFLIELIRSFDEDEHGSFGELAADVKADTASTNGTYLANDRFLNVFSYLVTDNDFFDVFALFLSKLEDFDVKAALAFDDGGASLRPLVILCKNAQIAALNGGKAEDAIASAVKYGKSADITKITDRKDLIVMLDAVLAKDPLELGKAFAGVDFTLITSLNYDKTGVVLGGGAKVRGFAEWAYDNRKKFNGLATAYSAEYLNRAGKPAQQNLMANKILEYAWLDNKIGNNNEGVIAVIKDKFLPKEALKATTRYRLFAESESAGTLLFSLLYNTAQFEIVESLRKGGTTLTQDGQYQLAANAIQRITQVITPTNIDAVLNTSVGGIAGIAAENQKSIIDAIKIGVLTPITVQSLAGALSAELEPGDWATMCTDDKNGGAGNKKVWELLNIVMDSHPQDEAAVKLILGY
jgi:hypothetical protein